MLKLNRKDHAEPSINQRRDEETNWQGQREDLFESRCNISAMSKPEMAPGSARGKRCLELREGHWAKFFHMEAMSGCRQLGA
jgi:hypothetical protein